jgi:hypothetical protein
MGLCDPIKVFIKDEPHKASKISEGRLRIISSVSLVDQIIERLLCSGQNNVEIDMWEGLQSKPGMGLHDAGLDVLRSNIEGLLEVNGEVMCTDVSAWDWSVPEWLLRDEMEVRAILGGSQPLYTHFCRVIGMVVSRSLYVDPDGMCWDSKYHGIQNSGRYCTSSSNSRMRVMLSMMCRKLAGKSPVLAPFDIIAMGDDSVEVSCREAVPFFERLGFKVSMVTFHSAVKGVEFCSHFFGETGAYPVSPAKTCYRFFSRPSSFQEFSDLQAQLAYYLRHCGKDFRDKIASMTTARVERAKKFV